MNYNQSSNQAKVSSDLGNSVAGLPLLQPATLTIATLTASVYPDTGAALVTILEELEEQGKLDFWLLKDQNVAAFWNSHLDRRRKRELYRQAVSKMRSMFTTEELDILKIRLPPEEDIT